MVQGEETSLICRRRKVLGGSPSRSGRSGYRSCFGCSVPEALRPTSMAVRASGEILKCGDCPVYGEDGVDGGKGGR